MISLVIMIDSEMKLLKVFYFFFGNAHIQFKIGVLNASISYFIDGAEYNTKINLLGDCTFYLLMLKTTNDINYIH